MPRPPQRRFVSQARKPISRKPLALEPLEDRVVPTAGALDPTFGAGGFVTTGVPGSSVDSAEGVVVVQLSASTVAVLDNLFANGLMS